jgi:hypothetical protein
MRTEESIRREYHEWEEVRENIPESAPEHIKTSADARISLFRWILED